MRNGCRVLAAALLLAGLSGCASWNWREAGRNWLESLCRSEPNMSCHGEDPLVRAIPGAESHAKG